MRAGPRCARCYLRPANCICADIPEVATRTRVLILRHTSERKRPSCTARVAALALPNSQLIDYGEDELPDLAGASLLFPGGPTQTHVAEPPAQLLVLDGTWTQARRMLNRVPALANLPRLALPAAATPLPRLRKQTHADHMSTLEAIIRALALLEGAELAAPLETLLGRLVAGARHQS